MADFSPFAGVRYPDAARPPSSPRSSLHPTTSIDDDQRATLEATDEHNSVRLILPRDEAAEGDRYARAAATFARWRAEGVLVARSDAALLRVPHGVHRPARRPPPHPRA